MITIELPSKKPTPVLKTIASWISSTPTTKESKNTTVYEEAKRRDEVIRKLSLECKYRAGDICKISPEAKEEKCIAKGDEIYVTGIASSYAALGKDSVWPDNDLPMIVTAYNRTKKLTFFCTTNMLEKVPYGT